MNLHHTYQEPQFKCEWIWEEPAFMHYYKINT